METALHHMRKVIEWVAENYTPHQAEDIRGRLRQGSADEITQWFQASINVISPVNSQEPPTHHNVGGEYEQGEGGADPNDEGADWGDNTDREDTTVGPCETPSATTTRDRSGKPWNEEDEKNTRATETKGAGHFEDDILGEHDARPCATPSASKKDDTKGTGDLVDDTLREHTKRPCETPSASKEKPTPPGQEERRGGYRTRQSSQRRERPHGEQKANKPRGEDTREHRRDEPQKPRRDEDEYEEVAVDPEDVTKAETENSGGATTGRLRPAEPQHPPENLGGDCRHPRCKVLSHRQRHGNHYNDKLDAKLSHPHVSTAGEQTETTQQELTQHRKNRPHGESQEDHVKHHRLPGPNSIGASMREKVGRLQQRGDHPRPQGDHTRCMESHVKDHRLGGKSPNTTTDHPYQGREDWTELGETPQGAVKI